MSEAAFTVQGVPIPEGSKTPVIRRRANGQQFVFLMDGRDAKAQKAFKRWRADITTIATRAWAGRPPIEAQHAVAITLSFRILPPATIPKGRWAPSVAPDLDKLVRAVGDSLTGVVYVDDGQIVDIHTRKRYVRDGEKPGVDILVGELFDPDTPTLNI